MDSARVTTRGRIVIPRRIRRKFSIKPGTKVCFVERHNDILLRPVMKEDVRSICGILRSMTSATEELLNERRKDKTREEIKRQRLGVPRCKF